MKHNEIESGMILVYKGGMWKCLLKSIKHTSTFFFGFTSMVIQVVTLSRYIHTASIIKKENDWYLVEAVPSKGVVVGKIHNFDKIINQINSNEVDVFQQADFNSELFWHRLPDLVGKRYSFLKIFNIGLWNIFGLNLIRRVDKKYFCSDLTSYLHNIQEKKHFHLTSPADLAHSDLVRKIK
jgi:hypothetical protein